MFVGVAVVLDVPSPYGDIVDRITILELKCERIPDPTRVAIARALQQALRARWAEAGLPAIEALPQYVPLKEINARLWEVEDALRERERQQRFDEQFVALARAVYQSNDQRAILKAAIDASLGSSLSEPKWHPPQ